LIDRFVGVGLATEAGASDAIDGDGNGDNDVGEEDDEEKQAMGGEATSIRAGGTAGTAKTGTGEVAAYHQRLQMGYDLGGIHDITALKIGHEFAEMFFLLHRRPPVTTPAADPTTVLAPDIGLRHTLV
jgi:hypothetical protein